MPATYRISNQSQALIQPLVVRNCTSFGCKLLGLAWQAPIAQDHGLLLVLPKEGRKSAGIHMLGMFSHLTVVWLDGDYRVVDVRKAYAWRSIIYPQDRAKYVIECRLSRFDEFKIGDQLVLEAS